MKLIKDKDSGVYHAKFKDLDGKDHTRTTKSKNLEDAKKAIERAKLIEIEAAAKAGTLSAETLMAIMAGRKVTSTDALKEWSDWRNKNAEPNTVRTQYLAVRAMLQHYRGEKWPVTKWDFDHLDGFVNSDDAGSRSNRDSRLASIRSWFQFLTARAYRVDDPSKLVRVRLKSMTHEQKEAKKRVPFTDAEFRHIIAHTEGFWKWATALSYWAGLRISDVACLEWASVLPDEIVVWTGKGGTRVALPIDDPLIGGGALRMIFMEMMEYSQHPKYVFPAERAEITDPTKRAKYSVYYPRILSRLGIEGKSFHCLRHSFATRLKKAGKSVEEVGTAVGHTASSVKSGVTAGYIHE